MVKVLEGYGVAKKFIPCINGFKKKKKRRTGKLFFILDVVYDIKFTTSYTINESRRVV